MTGSRCAIYTRKSSEEGLDQAYNSLDAQRDACEAYVASQKHEGWSAIRTLYDDGGWSGGSMERPALKRLLADIAAGRIDIIVVYKVDRLTRSLSDFARMVELFDAHKVSFVSVTQAFNTTTSMGRLTLNVLLSFAQFEREVTGERIRDKIAASKKRGMWMGGFPPLGYDPDGRTLVVNEKEARIVRHIFARYLELRSVHVLARELDAEGIRSKRWTSAGGNVRGDVPLRRGPLRHMLGNRLYVGEIVHRDLCWPGQHEGIVDLAVFDAVQARLVGSRTGRRERIESNAPLTGALFDAAGNRMSPVSARGKSGQKYPYYVSSALLTGGKLDAGVIGRIRADVIGDIVIARLRQWSGRPDSGWRELVPLISRIELHRTRLVMDIRPDDHADWPSRIAAPDTQQPAPDGILRVIVPAIIRTRGGRTWLSEANTASRMARPNRTLIAGLHRAHRELNQRGLDMTDPRPDPANATGLKDPYIRKLSSLAFLAPDIQCAILTGQQPAGLTLKQIMRITLPLDWSLQRKALGFTPD